MHIDIHIYFTTCETTASYVLNLASAYFLLFAYMLFPFVAVVVAIFRKNAVSCHSTLHRPNPIETLRVKFSGEWKSHNNLGPSRNRSHLYNRLIHSLTLSYSPTMPTFINLFNYKNYIYTIIIFHTSSLRL